jgi:ribosomal protein S18 acetylase RimI-like enzyme
MTLRVRPATDADVEAMAEVWVLANRVRQSDAGLPPAETLDGARDQLAARLSGANGRTRALVSCDGAHVMGMCMGLQARENDGAGPADIPGLLHVSMLAVMPEAWGRRLGARMLTTLLDDARSAGYADAQLWTQQSNGRAIAIYTRLGFTRSGRTKQDERGESIAHWTRSLR